VFDEFCICSAALRLNFGDSGKVIFGRQNLKVLLEEVQEEHAVESGGIWALNLFLL
jgi:hypothetical protein